MKKSLVFLLLIPTLTFAKTLSLSNDSIQEKIAPIVSYDPHMLCFNGKCSELQYYIFDQCIVAISGNIGDESFFAWGDPYIKGYCTDHPRKAIRNLMIQVKHRFPKAYIDDFINRRKRH